MNNRQIIIEPNMEVFSKLGVKSIEIKTILLNTRIKRIFLISIFFTPNFSKTSILGSIIICLLFISILQSSYYKLVYLSPNNLSKIIATAALTDR